MRGDSVPHKIERFDGCSGAFIDLFIAPGPDGVFDPGQMLLHSGGKLYIASENSSQVRRFDPSTGARRDILASGPELAESHSIWFGANGNLFATSRGNDHIFEFEGVSSAAIGVFATDPGMTSPTCAILVPGPPALAYSLLV